MTPATPPDPDDTPMTARYAGAVVLEAVIITLLFLLGRLYS